MKTAAFPYLSDFVKALTGFDLPLPLPMFGLMVASALLVSIWVASGELKRLHEAGLIGLAQRSVKGRDGRRVEEFVPPEGIVGEFSTIVVIVGIIGARIFHLLEHPREFAAGPWEMIFSRSGFSVLGGLIFGAVAGAIYVKRRGLPIRVVCDAVAPALMLGYAIGRIGCQLSGDGDWGIRANMAIKPDWVPIWLWAQTYDNNIIGVTIPPPGVYPAPVFETLMALAGFAVLWSVRKHPFRAGWLFALYLLLGGAERLLIERIRVNPVFHVLGVSATQAEIVSVVLIVLGIAGLASLSRKFRLTPDPGALNNGHVRS